MEHQQAEAGPRTSERLFWATFDRAVVGIAHVAPDGRWLRYNQWLCDLLGYSRDELAARTFQDITHPDDLAASLASLQRLLAGECDAEELDKRYLRKDGTPIWVHATISLVRTPEGAPDYFITMVQDITERQRLEQERARLLEWERAARREAEAANTRLQALQALTDTALSHLALDDLLRELLDRVTDVMGVDNVSILLLDADGQTLTPRAVRGRLEEAIGWVHIPVGQGFSGRVAARQEPLIVDDVSTFDVGHPIMQKHLRSVVGVPLLAEDPVGGRLVSRLVGVVHVGSATPRHFTEADVQLLQRAADRIAMAIDRARLYAAEQDARRQAEAALARAQASEAQATERAERLNTILENVADGIAMYDAEGRPIQTNRAYRELLATDHLPGYAATSPAERGALLDMRDAASGAQLLPERVPAARALHGEVVTGPGADIRMRALDGHELEVNSSAAPLREPDGRIVGAVSVVRDVTWRKHLEREREAALARALVSEAQAAERAEQLHIILETMADAVAVYDAEGRPIQMVNRAYRELFALDHAPAEYEALPTFDRARLVHVGDAATGALLPFEATPVGRALGGEVVTGPSADIRARAFDGRELELNSSAAPLRDGDGRVVGTVLVLRDMTERNRLAREREAARVQAERQAEQLDRIFEAVADGLVVYDSEGRITQENPAARRILGMDAAPPGFFRLPLRERAARYAARDEQSRLLPFEEPPFVRTLGAEVGTGIGPEVRDVRMRALDGREVELHVAPAPLRDQQGHLVGAVVVMHDQTERNRLAREREAARADELAAREASRRMEAFLAVAAHDLRAPLTGVVGYLALAARQTERLAAAAQGERPELPRQVAAVRQRLEDVRQGAARLTRLLTLLFDTAAIRADRLELHRAPGDLAVLVREQVEALRVAAPGRVIHLHTPAGGGPVPVEADADRIGQVVANYLTNALKYAPPDRPVDVSVEGPTATGGGWARVAVRDRGPGIPEAERARVWELFHRAPGVVAPGGSLGLGLYICKAIVEAHGGQVGIDSAVGKGSTFWFTLPLAAAHA